MTTKDAILKLADAVSGNTSANVATDVQALAVLAQAMTGGVPAEPLATVDDAIGYIADNYSGGGGGVDVGAPWRSVIGFAEVPSVGDVIPSPPDTVMADYVMVGDTIVAGTAAVLAAGTTFVLTDEDVEPTLLLLTTNGIQDNEQITAAEDISSIVSIIEIPDVSDNCVAFTMPDNPAQTKRLAIVWAD